MFRRCFPGSRCFGGATNAVPPEFTETIAFDEDFQTQIFRILGSETFFTYRVPAGQHMRVQYTEEGSSLRRVSDEERKARVLDYVKEALTNLGQLWQNYYPSGPYSHVDIKRSIHFKKTPTDSPVDRLAIQDKSRRPKTLAFVAVYPLEVHWYREPLSGGDIRELHPVEVRRLLDLEPQPNRYTIARIRNRRGEDPVQPAGNENEENPHTPVVVGVSNNLSTDPRNPATRRRRDRTARRNQKRLKANRRETRRRANKRLT